jgi:hypothetical protein
MRRFRCVFFAYVAVERYCPKEAVIATIHGRRMAAVAHAETAVEALQRGFLACERLGIDAVPLVVDALGHIICGRLPPSRFAPARCSLFDR